MAGEHSGYVHLFWSDEAKKDAGKAIYKVEDIDSIYESHLETLATKQKQSIIKTSSNISKDEGAQLLTAFFNAIDDSGGNFFSQIVKESIKIDEVPISLSGIDRDASEIIELLSVQVIDEMSSNVLKMCEKNENISLENAASAAHVLTTAGLNVGVGKATNENKNSKGQKEKIIGYKANNLSKVIEALKKLAENCENQIPKGRRAFYNSFLEEYQKNLLKGDIKIQEALNKALKVIPEEDTKAREEVTKDVNKHIHNEKLYFSYVDDDKKFGNLDKAQWLQGINKAVKSLEAAYKAYNDEATAYATESTNAALENREAEYNTTTNKKGKKILLKESLEEKLSSCFNNFSKYITENGLCLFDSADIAGFLSEGIHVEFVGSRSTGTQKSVINNGSGAIKRGGTGKSDSVSLVRISGKVRKKSGEEVDASIEVELTSSIKGGASFASAVRSLDGHKRLEDFLKESPKQVKAAEIKIGSLLDQTYGHQAIENLTAPTYYRFAGPKKLKKNMTVLADKTKAIQNFNKVFSIVSLLQILTGFSDQTSEGALVFVHGNTGFTMTEIMSLFRKTYNNPEDFGRKETPKITGLPTEVIKRGGKGTKNRISVTDMEKANKIENKVTEYHRSQTEFDLADAMNKRVDSVRACYKDSLSRLKTVRIYLNQAFMKELLKNI